jgi:hypothetical protein
LFTVTNIIRRQAALVLMSAMLAIFAPPPRAAAVDFLIPGMSLRSVSLIPGARVSYLVVSESFGAADSSCVELGVLKHASGEFRLEIVTGPYPLTKKDRVTVRLRLADRALSISSADEFRSCMKEILLKEGTGKFRAPSARELDDLDIERLFMRPSEGMEKTLLEDAKVVTPAGAFLCEGVRCSGREARAVNLGGVKAERIVETASELWTSREIPLWGLAKSTVEETSHTNVAGAHPAPASVRATTTTSILIAYKRPRDRS